MKVPKDTSIGSSVLVIAIIASWITGIAIAKGFWATFFSIVIAPYAWYLVAEHFLNI